MSTINWRRGLFRLWIVGAALFVLVVAFISYSKVKAEFEAVAFQDQWPGELLLPQSCGEARGQAGTDYTTKQGQKPGPWDMYAKPDPFANCWYAISKFRPLYPEFNNLTDRELSRKLYAAHGMPIRDLRPWATLGMWLSIAFGIPLVVLVLGASLVWAFSGFAATRP